MVLLDIELFCLTHSSGKLAIAIELAEYSE